MDARVNQLLMDAWLIDVNTLVLFLALSLQLCNLAALTPTLRLTYQTIGTLGVYGGESNTVTIGIWDTKGSTRSGEIG